MIDITMTFRLFLLPNFAANQSVTVMEIITFESKAYKELDNKITAIADYIFNHAEMAKQSEEDMWVDSYEVCTFLKISEKDPATPAGIRDYRLFNIGDVTSTRSTKIRRMLEERLIRATRRTSTT